MSQTNTFVLMTLSLGGTDQGEVFLLKLVLGCVSEDVEENLGSCQTCTD